ncbi:bifunctional diaminohydroxyphosphoribosylaminopyrimidine deaminase/5-amino-6-(5-phosphoribosylamino)uracil reductase RibD [Halothermothrix orenii]|uniref:Riboflavin biosynthesis protein RibD n=1 Tax=Halothermothrix orenii (strain H 168 / OCM 544 / DSM 9562) TaxID=373903 RepID=B8CWT6_HALOH|nr:bifunctional diaminohydroxyphosphoribosylaminopyrimidine deaminase/5-amino-6-(5-phosphoribosylamino)uracil reductase RibD [Halothermothrix orenii]ACL69755.1 riboflavin biosynthesis protein RibD [Halothermothrix orenii H 168]
MDKDIYYMEKALTLARKGVGYTSPNPMVGAVVVRDDKIVGEGHHRYYGGPHAEVYALEEAGEKAFGSTLYVNLEPCSHYGKTPPCVFKIIESGVKRVVISMVDPNPRVSGKGIEMLKKAGIEVTVGVLEEKARNLNEVFIKNITNRMPFVYLKMAQTLDGYLATSSGDSRWVTGKKARQYVHRLRHRVDAILVGIGTVLKDDPRLTTRLSDGKGKDSIKIVLDSKLKIPLTANILNQENDAPVIIVCGHRVDSHKKKSLKQLKSVEVLSLDLNEYGQIPIKELLINLNKKGISSLLVEGGGRVNYSFLKEGFVDKMLFFIAPKLLGGSDGVSVFDGKGAEVMAKVKKLKKYKIEEIGEDILITGTL